MEKLGHDVVERVDLPLLNIWPLLSRLVLRPWLLILLGVLARMLQLSLHICRRGWGCCSMCGGNSAASRLSEAMASVSKDL